MCSVCALVAGNVACVCLGWEPEGPPVHGGVLSVSLTGGRPGWFQTEGQDPVEAKERGGHLEHGFWGGKRGRHRALMEAFVSDAGR